MALIQHGDAPTVRGMSYDARPNRFPGAWYGLILILLGAPAASAAEETITNLWEVDIGTYCDSSPALADDGTIYFGTWTGKLWALNPEGSRKWIFSADREIKSSPTVGADGTIYVGSRDRRLYAVGPRGRKRWTFKTGGWVDSSPGLTADGTICFGSWDGNFYVVRPDGTRQWHFQTSGPIVSSPAIGSDGTIYFGSHDGKFYALGPDGQKRWEFSTGGPIISSPAPGGDGSLYFSSLDGWFYALNRDGSLRWRLKTGGITEASPVIGLDGTIYVGVNKSLWMIAADGKKKWENRREPYAFFVVSPLLFASGSIMYFPQGGEIITVGCEDHLLRWRWYLGPFGASPTVDARGIVYLPIARGNFVGFTALETHESLAKTSWPKFRGNPRNTGTVRDCLR